MTQPSSHGTATAPNLSKIDERWQRARVVVERRWRQRRRRRRGGGTYACRAARWPAGARGTASARCPCSAAVMPEPPGSARRLVDEATPSARVEPAPMARPAPGAAAATTTAITIAEASQSADADADRAAAGRGTAIRSCCISCSSSLSMAEGGLESAAAAKGAGERASE